MSTLGYESSLSSHVAIGFLVSAGGNAKLAAARASKELGFEVTDALLLTVIASDPGSVDVLARQARVLVLLQTIDALRLTHVAYLSSLVDLSPRDVSQSYVALTDAVSKLAQQSPRDETLDTNRLVNALPKKVADAVRYFLENEDDDSTLVQPAPVQPEKAA